MIARRTLVLLLLVTGVCACAHAPAIETRTAGDLDTDIARAHEAGLAGDWVRAAHIYEVVLKADGSRLAAHRGRIEAAFHLGHLARVEDTYRRLLAHSPKDPYALYGLAITLYTESTANAQRCLALLARAAALDPGAADLPFRQGVILLDAERWDDARKVLARAVTLAPKVARYRVPYALALFHSGEHKQALSVLHDILDLNPDAREVAKAREVAHRITDPFRHFPQAARQRVDRAIDWLEKADVPQNAIDLLQDVLKEYPELAIVHGLIGLAYERIENGGEAMVHLERAIELSPDLPQPHLYLGNFFYSHQRYEDARKQYLLALDHDPLMLDAYVMLARMAVQRSDTPEAIHDLQSWALLAPTQTGPRLMLARVLAGAGDLGRATRVLESVLKLDAGNLEAHLSLGAIFVKQHELARDPATRKDYAKKARDHLRAVLDSQPGNAAARRLLEKLQG